MDLIAKNLAELIRSLRQNTGLSQRALAEGICSQSEISHIENGKIIPCIYTLISISEKLGVNPNYFIDRVSIEKYDLVHILKNEIREYAHNKEYFKMDVLLKKYETDSCFQSLEEKQFLFWHKGIVEYYVYNNASTSEDYFNYALSLRDSFYKTNQDIHILNSYAIIKSEEKKYQKSIEIFDTAIQYYRTSDVILDSKLYIKLLYNLSKTHFKLSNYPVAEQYCDLGIEQCKKEYTNFLYGELFYHKAYIQQAQQNYKQSITFFKKALFIFEEYNRKEYISATLEKIAEVENLKSSQS